VPPTQSPQQKASEAQGAGGHIVARGRSVLHGGKTYGPGATVPDLSKEEVAWLLQAKFLVRTADTPNTGKGVSVGGLRIVGGRRPGGVAN
jgi:hypothetical protein